MSVGSEGRYAMASRLTAAWGGYSSPSLHAVPVDAAVHNATALCGVRGLTVIVEHYGPAAFDALSPYSCRRCVRRVALYPEPTP